MRTLALVIGFVFLLCSGAPAQDTKPPEPAPTFSSHTELVLVPALVREKSGASISGLAQSDFTLLENGAEQKIAVFEEIKTAAARFAWPPLSAAEFSNYSGSQPATRRLTIIMMDSINTEFADRAYAHEQILKFLGEMAGSHEPIALLQLHRGGVRVIHDFTTDPALLAKALRRFRTGEAPVAETESSLQDPAAVTGTQADDTPKLALEAQQVANLMNDMEQNMLAGQRLLAARLTLDGMQQVAHAFAGIPGRKALIWASAGFPFSIDDLSRAFSGSGGLPSYVADILPYYEKTWRALNDANVALYPVDVRGLLVLGPSASSGSSSASAYEAQRAMRQAILRHQDTLSTFTAFADMTGGKAYFNTNDLVRAFHDAVEDSSSYYLLGFYLRPEDRKPGWRKLQVKVKHAQAHVRSRSGFYVLPEDKDKNKTRVDDVVMAMSSPLDFTSLPVRGRWLGASSGGEDKKRATFKLTLPPDAALVDESDHNHLSLDFEYAARESTGKVVASNGRTIEAHLKPESLAKIRSAGITYEDAVDLPPGEYTVRFVVRDNLSGRLGSVSTPVIVP